MINALNYMCMHAVDVRAFARVHVIVAFMWFRELYNGQIINILNNSWFWISVLNFGREVVLCVHYLRSMQSLLSPRSHECNE